MQDEKRAFLEARATAAPQTSVGHALQDPRSPYEVKAGTIIPAVLLTGISSDLPGQIMAQVREQVYDTVTGQHLLIPQGTRLIGQYDSVVAFGQNRVLLVWDRLILPNGASVLLAGMPGVDLTGFAGLKDRVNHHWGRILGAVVLSSLFNIGARVPFGDPQPNQFFPTLGQEFVRDAGEGINQAGQQIVSKTLNIQPTLTIRPGTSFNVFVHQDLVLRPYRPALTRPRVLQEEPRP
jgi:type IV secretion system protein VirB10